tara:strand:+ start:1153 stop:2121 length:969 start_codon:yes stop_codon:yes gene_type:complete
MKVVIYGASVTAQKNKDGFFHYLEENSEFEITRIPFGASHLQFAGIAMISKVIEQQPEVCILDWVTPSTKVFPMGVVERINRILHQNNILPVWVLFPRTDDPKCERECCKQIIATESDTVLVRNFTRSRFSQGHELSDILRDAVHTNKLGAPLYAEYIVDSLKQLDLTKFMNLSFSREHESVPIVLRNELKIDTDNKLSLDLVILEESDINIYMFCNIGPTSPILNLTLVKDDNVVFIGQRNIVDPWCYYYRDMLINLPTFKNLKMGKYKLIISISDDDPFDKVNTLKPIENDSSSKELGRFLKTYEISIDGNLKVEMLNEL